MAVFTLACASGAPGVTTCALGLALAWPRDVVLVDADRSASQALLAGYFNGVATGGRGLTAVAQAYRDGLNISDDLPSNFVSFPGDHDTQKWLLPGYARPGSAQLFEPVWPELAAALDDLDRMGIDAIVDIGRWGAGLPPDLLAVTRALALVTRTSLRSLAALRLYSPDATAAVANQAGCSAGLLVVGAGDPYDPRDIGEQFGLPVWGRLPWHPADAAALIEGTPPRRGVANRPLASSFDATATVLRGVAQAWDNRVKRSSESGALQYA